MRAILAVYDKRGVADFARGLHELGIELVADRQTKAPAPETGAAVSRRCLELGACLNISRRSMAGVFRLAPPLTVSRDEIDSAVAILDQALGECGKA